MQESGEFKDKVVVMAMSSQTGEDRVHASMCVDPKDVQNARTVLGVVSTDLREIPMPSPR
jgi:hypothetical protein